MLGLPKSTELSKPLPKKAFYAKFATDSAEQKRFDADISRMTIIHELSPNTVNIAAGESIKAIYVLRVLLKTETFNTGTISKLCKLINQRLILLLEYNDRCCLAAHHTQLIMGKWQMTEQVSLELQGLNFDAVWESLVRQIGDFTKTTDGQQATLAEEIAVSSELEKLRKRLALVERKAWNEKQPRAKQQLVQEVRRIKKELEGLGYEAN